MTKAIKFFSTKEKGILLTGSRQLDCCVAIEIGNDNVQQIPGYIGQVIAAACASCQSIKWPYDHLSHKCGWITHSMGTKNTTNHMDSNPLE